MKTLLCAVSCLTAVLGVSGETKFSLDAGGSDDGTVTIGSETGRTVTIQCEPGSTVTVSPGVAAEGKEFLRWTGDVNLEGSCVRTISVVMDRDRRLVPLFAPIGDTEALRAAVTAAKAGSTVTVAPGVYRLGGSPLTVTAKDVTLKGASGDPRDVVIDAEGLSRCLYANVSGTTVIGISFRRGYHVANGAGYANEFGGGAYLTSACVTNCAFAECVVTNGGGGAVHASSTAFRKCLFEGNAIWGVSGGALNCASGCSVDGCSFFGNRQWTCVSSDFYGGGALNVATGTPVSNCVFVANNALYGGALHGVPSLVEGCSFTNNFATRGGVAYVSVGTGSAPSVRPLFRNCTMFGNSASARGGVLSPRDKEPYRMERCVCISNTCASGGIISDYSAKTSQSFLLSISNCVFRGNVHAGTGGAATLVYDKPEIVYGCTFEDNRFKADITGMILLGDGSLVDACSFVGNRHDGDKSNFSQLRVAGTDAAVRNCLFATNYAGKCQGVCISVTSGKSVSVDNCTFAYNRQNQGAMADYYGGLLNLQAGCQVRNCLFYNNVDGGGYPILFKKSAAVPADTFFNCCEVGTKTQLTNKENDNIVGGTIDFRFSNPNPYASGDYSIRPGSDLDGAGQKLDWMVAKTKDITMKHPRVRETNPSIGAWEAWAAPGLMLLLK